MMTADETPLEKCPACNGRGYHRCECWPGDCICGWGDETCEECGGDGCYDQDQWDYYDFVYDDPEEPEQEPSP